MLIVTLLYTDDSINGQSKVVTNTQIISSCYFLDWDDSDIKIVRKLIWKLEVLAYVPTAKAIGKTKNLDLTYLIMFIVTPDSNWRR